MGFSPSQGSLEIEASHTEISTLELAPLTTDGRLNGAVRFTKLTTAGRWAPSAFIGFGDRDQRGKFRVFLYQESLFGPLVAGYDYVLHDRLVLREIVVHDMPRKMALVVRVDWNENGQFRVAFFDGKRHVVETQLQSLVPFIAVSSGRAKFSLQWAAEPHRSAAYIRDL